jgi:hypothetical protein
MRIFATFWLLALITLHLLRTTVSTEEHDSAPTVITHATIINPRTSSVQENRAVVIIGDHISSISEMEKFQSPKNARVIDATGQYLIPGLWDMHVHSAFGDWFPGGRDIILPLFIANGVIGVRDMGGDTPILVEWRKEIADGQIIGPRMIISGPMLDGYLPDGKLRFPSSIPITTPASRGCRGLTQNAGRGLHQSPVGHFARCLSGRRCGSPQKRFAHCRSCAGQSSP